MQHSNVIGGSTAKRVINCPGSVALSRKMPSNGTSEYAEVGTALHEVMEGLIAETLTHDKVVGYVAANGITITEELATSKVAPAWQALMEIFDRYDVVEYMEETRVFFHDNPDVFGTTDVLARTSDDRLLVIDFKFGDGVMVPPDDNYQLKFYATAAAHTPGLAEFIQGCREVSFVIIQPTERADEVWASWDVPESFSEMTLVFKSQVFAAIRMSEKPGAPVNAGDWCGFCPAQPICPQKTGAARSALSIDPDAFVQNGMSGLGEALRLADELENWIRAVRKLGQQQLENGFAVDGWKLVDKRATRKWVDEDDVLDKVRRMKKLKLEEATVTSLVSPAQMEKVCKKFGVDFNVFADYIVSKSSGTTMAPADDKRPEASASLEQALAGLAQQI